MLLIFSIIDVDCQTFSDRSGNIRITMYELLNIRIEVFDQFQLNRGCLLILRDQDNTAAPFLNVCRGLGDASGNSILGNKAEVLKNSTERRGSICGES